MSPRRRPPATRSRSRPRLALATPALLGAVCALAWACDDSLGPRDRAAPGAGAGRPQLAYSWSGGCGVSFTAVLTNEDDLLAAYGVPPTSDTIQFCETWTGSDYLVSETTVSSAFNAFHEPDTLRTVEYAGGAVYGYNASGGAMHPPVSVGPTSFDFMQVDDATRQASYDDPYWAVYSDDQGNPCPGTQRACRIALPPESRTVSESGTRPQLATGGAASAPLFQRHGVRRRGARALVENATELGRSPQGHRRFHTRRGDADVVLTLDKDTELLIGQETTAPGRRTKVTHEWQAHPRGGFARARTVAESVETLEGRPVRSRTTITISNLTRAAGGDSASASAVARPEVRQ